MKVPTRMFSGSAALAAIALASAPAVADHHGIETISPTATPTIAELRLGLVGTWAGELEYLDYQSGQWFGLPLNVAIEDGGDGATLIRKSDFDDGPEVGNVRIISTAMFLPDTNSEYIGTFRAGRPAELAAFSIALIAAEDATHWTMIAETDGEDGNQPARIRETTVRNGDVLTTLKQVDPANDGADEWITRNRTTLTLTPPTPANSARTTPE